MAGRKISGVELRAVSAAVPEFLTTESDFSELYGEKQVARITKETGIRSIREGKALKTSDLICAACESLFSNGVVDVAEVDGLVVVTQTPDDWCPGTSFHVHERLGIAKDCFLSDITAGCAGYITGMTQAAALVSSGACKKVIVCTGDITTQLISDSDQHLRMLFGDAASATLICAGDHEVQVKTGADGSGAGVLGATIEYSKQTGPCVSNLYMDGMAVLNFALSTVPDLIKDICADSQLEPDDLDLLVLHQANEFIINYLRRTIGIAPEKLPIDVDGLGNTSSTSIPYVLSRHPAVGTKNAENVVLCGFGAGMSWGAVRVNLSQMTSIPPVTVSAATTNNLS